MPKNALSILKNRFASDSVMKYEVALANLCAEVAEELVEAREKAGLTQGELAKRIGTSQSSIARVEDSDYDGHSLRTIARIACELNLRVTLKFNNEAARPIAFNVVKGAECSTPYFLSLTPINSNNRGLYEQEEAEVTETAGDIPRWHGKATTGGYGTSQGATANYMG